MQPRILFRTHYQVDEPAHMEFLVKLCTSPVQSSYREVVAQRLAQEITNNRAKDFNKDAAAYAVDLGKDLGLLTQNNTWTDKGHLVGLIAEIQDGTWQKQLALTLPERLLHFRLFLAGDGAAFLYIAKRLLHNNVLPPDLHWNSFAKEMFIAVYSEYLSHTILTSDRVELQQIIERIKLNGYQGNSGNHKCFIHMQTLNRLGLVDRADPTEHKYRLPESSLGRPSGIETLIKEIPDVFSLENVVESHRWIELAAKVFQIASSDCDDDRAILSLMVEYYERIVSCGTPHCPLSTLIEAVQIELLAKRSQLLTHNSAMAVIKAAQKQSPKDVRFHVDRHGKPAFMRLSDAFVARYAHCEAVE
jgi:hypothetical protein